MLGCKVVPMVLEKLDNWWIDCYYLYKEMETYLQEELGRTQPLDLSKPKVSLLTNTVWYRTPSRPYRPMTLESTMLDNSVLWIRNRKDPNLFAGFGSERIWIPVQIICFKHFWTLMFLKIVSCGEKEEWYLRSGINRYVWLLDWGTVHSYAPEFSRRLLLYVFMVPSFSWKLLGLGALKKFADLHGTDFL